MRNESLWYLAIPPLRKALIFSGSSLESASDESDQEKKLRFVEICSTLLTTVPWQQFGTLVTTKITDFTLSTD